MMSHKLGKRRRLDQSNGPSTDEPKVETYIRDDGRLGISVENPGISLDQLLNGEIMPGVFANIRFHGEKH